MLDRIAGTSFYISRRVGAQRQITATHRRLTVCCGSTSSGSSVIRRYTSSFFRRLESSAMSCRRLSAQAAPRSSRVLTACMVLHRLPQLVVWGHHMFVSGMSPFSATVVLGSDDVHHDSVDHLDADAGYSRSMARKSDFRHPRFFLWDFFRVFVSGGIGGFFLAQPSIDILSARNVFRCRPLPFHDGGMSAVSAISRAPITGSRNDWPHDERDPREGSLLA